MADGVQLLASVNVQEGPAEGSQDLPSGLPAPGALPDAAFNPSVVAEAFATVLQAQPAPSAPSTAAPAPTPSSAPVPASAQARSQHESPDLGAHHGTAKVLCIGVAE